MVQPADTVIIFPTGYTRVVRIQELITLTRVLISSYTYIELLYRSVPLAVRFSAPLAWRTPPSNVFFKEDATRWKSQAEEGTAVTWYILHIHTRSKSVKYRRDWIDRELRFRLGSRDLNSRFGRLITSELMIGCVKNRRNMAWGRRYSRKRIGGEGKPKDRSAQ